MRLRVMQEFGPKEDGEPGRAVANVGSTARGDPESGGTRKKAGLYGNAVEEWCGGVDAGEES